ncbi:MAG: 10 kDa chaperonin [Planctomycetaceae bacterium]|nr:MAG: 10 kDa chaperonin [Planctomycetaceae bacterium]
MAKKQGINIVPLGDRVVVDASRLKRQPRAASCFPIGPQRTSPAGEVVAVGDGYVKSDGDKIALTVQDGDKVIFSSYAGDEIQIGDEELLLLRESDILATF